MEERVHPIPFRTRQLSSPSSMILHILVWESRTVPRLYFEGPPVQAGLFSCSDSPLPTVLRRFPERAPLLKRQLPLHARRSRTCWFIRGIPSVCIPAALSLLLPDHTGFTLELSDPQKQAAGKFYLCSASILPSRISNTLLIFPPFLCPPGLRRLQGVFCVSLERW